MSESPRERYVFLLCRYVSFVELTIPKFPPEPVLKMSLQLPSNLAVIFTLLFALECDASFHVLFLLLNMGIHTCYISLFLSHFV